MATTAVGEQVQDVVTERNDVIVGYDLKATTKDGVATVEKVPAFHDANAETDKLIKEGKFVEDFKVTVSLPLAKTQKGIETICPDEAERCNNFNRGAKNKAANRLKARLLDQDADGKFTFGEADLTNGVFDLTEEIASETKRKSLTEEEKMDRFLADFPPAVREAMKATYLAATGKAAA